MNTKEVCRWDLIWRARLIGVMICRYLVTHLMGADLNNIVKCQKLTDDHVQFLIYQILRGLKVGDAYSVIFFFLFHTSCTVTSKSSKVSTPSLFWQDTVLDACCHDCPTHQYDIFCVVHPDHTQYKQ